MPADEHDSLALRLLGDIGESDTASRRSGERIMSFYQRSARPGAGRVRKLLEAWFAEYPARQKAALRQRLWGSDDDVFCAAFFELYVYTLLRRLQLDVEVPLSAGPYDTVEDFRVWRASQLVMRVAATCLESEQKHARQDGFIRDIQERIQALYCGDVRFSLHVRGEFKRQPRCGHVARRFVDWCAQNVAQIEEALKAGRGPQDLASFAVNEAGAGVELSPFCLKAKARKYPVETVPFVVAVCVSEGLDGIDICNALFGDEVCETRIGPDLDHYDTALKRKRNGLWLGPRGPQNTRVSGVLIADEVFCTSVAKQAPVLYLNPWAANAVPAGTLPIAQMVLNEAAGGLQRVPGPPIHEVFGLPSYWPFDPT